MTLPADDPKAGTVEDPDVHDPYGHLPQRRTPPEAQPVPEQATADEQDGVAAAPHPETQQGGEAVDPQQGDGKESAGGDVA